MLSGYTRYAWAFNLIRHSISLIRPIRPICLSPFEGRGYLVEQMQFLELLPDSISDPLVASGRQVMAVQQIQGGIGLAEACEFLSQVKCWQSEGMSAVKHCSPG